MEINSVKLVFTANTHIVGMSATLNNVGDLQKFLQAEYYTKNFRPVCTQNIVKQSILLLALKL